MPNWKQIGEKVAKSQKARKVAADSFASRVEEAKEQAISEFDEHPITQELEQGPAGENISGTLSGLQHGGNLFSFIGFFAGDEPTQIIRDILNRYIQGHRSSLKRETLKDGNIKFYFKVSYPTLQDFEEETPYPDGWQDGSFLYGIEHGIFGLSYYIYDEEFDKYEESHSTTGLEAKSKDGKMIVVRGASQSKPSKYVSAILRDFVKNLRAK